MIYRLLKDLPGDGYCLISRGDYRQEGYTRKLPGKYYHLPDFELKPDGSTGLIKQLKIIAKILLRILLIPSILWRARQIAAILEEEKCEALIACTGDDLFSLPAGYLASRMAGRPFYAYMFDYYSVVWVDPISRTFARLVEPIVVKGAAGIIVPNEFLGAALQRHYGVTPILIRNPVDVADYEAVPDDRAFGAGEEIRIVYTGDIYGAQFYAFRNLLKAIELLGRPELKLHLYTAQSPHDLEVRGIAGPVVYHAHQPLSAVPAIQRQADILFLPLAFTSSYPPEFINTSAPGKMGEYLAARRPILVHAPPDSFLVGYFRQHECGLIVDKNDPTSLAEGIEGLIDDASLRQKLSERAWDRAKFDLNARQARTAFAGLLKIGLPT